jgi:hypothetical protein
MVHSRLTRLRTNPAGQQHRQRAGGLGCHTYRGRCPLPRAAHRPFPLPFKAPPFPPSPLPGFPLLYTDVPDLAVAIKYDAQGMVGGDFECAGSLVPGMCAIARCGLKLECLCSPSCLQAGSSIHLAYWLNGCAAVP